MSDYEKIQVLKIALELAHIKQRNIMMYNHAADANLNTYIDALQEKLHKLVFAAAATIADVEVPECLPQDDDDEGAVDDGVEG